MSQSSELDLLTSQLELLLPEVRRASAKARNVEQLKIDLAKSEARVRLLEKELAFQRKGKAVSKEKAAKEKAAKEQDRLHRLSPQSQQPDGTPAERIQRMRSCSDDGAFFGSFARLRRVCSFTEDEQDAEESDSDPQPLEKGAKSLDQFAISQPSELGDHESATSQNRVGYRLLTCNDEQCLVQRIRTGLIHIPHLTKMLVRIKWISRPKRVLLVKKPHEVNCTQVMLQCAKFLITSGVAVFVEQAIFDKAKVVEGESDVLDQLSKVGVIASTKDDLEELPIDFCVCIGGDGTMIWMSHLFPRGCPPVASIAMGSLGFLSTFTEDKADSLLSDLLTKELTVTLRSRLTATVRFANGDEVNMSVLNEVSIDRGPQSTIVNLELYIGGMSEPITRVQGDGLIVATTTGSTAYSLAAGGSIVHPAIPCVVVTPICPHSLSFRPIIVPDTANIRLRVAADARKSAYVSFDGWNQLEIKQGDEVTIRVSEFPVPCICASGESEDWFRAIKNSFQWNERPVQKAHKL